MIRDIVRPSWAQSPGRTVAAVLLTPVVVVAVWLFTAIVIVALS